MKALRKINLKNRIALTLGVITIVISASIYMLVLAQDNTSIEAESSDTNSPSSQRIDVRPTSKDPSATQEAVEDDNIKVSDESPSAAAFPTTQPNLSVTINSATIQNGHLLVTSDIKPSTSGDCHIKLTKQGKNDSIQENIPFNGTRCTHSLNVSGLEKSTWSLTVQITVDSNVATATKSVEL